MTNTGTFKINLRGIGTGTDYAKLRIATPQGVQAPNTTVAPGAALVLGEDLEQGNQAAINLRLSNISLVDDRLWLLSPNSVTVSGPNASEFGILALPSGQIRRNSAKPLTITGLPGGPGLRSATVTVRSTDESQPVWTFNVSMSVRQTREIAVFGPSGIGIFDGDASPSVEDGTDFGAVPVAYGEKVVGFEVRNVGETSTLLDLTDTPIIRLLGAGAENFEVVRNPNTPLTGGQGSPFEIRFKPVRSGVQTAIVSIANSDDNENPFDFVVQANSVAPQPGSMHAGYTPLGEEVEESGAATLSIGVEVPPGTGGMAPTNLGIGYQHRIPNGLLGVGGELSGLSAITRGSRSLAQDGRIDAVNFDSNDQFFLDGQRLQLVSGTHGAAGAEYRTERESFSRIRIVGSQNGGPREWVVETKAGQKLFFGTTEDSRIEATGTAAVLTWALARVEDTVGNYLAWEYTEDNVNGAFYPNQILYTGNATQGLAPYNRVEFVWDDRLDDLPRFAAGSTVRYRKRLAAIRTFAEGTLVRTYAVAYDQSPSSYRSRMISVQEIAGDGSFYPPTRFTWSGSEFSATALRQDPVGADPVLAFQADMDGDGRTDFVFPQGNQVRIRFSRPSGFEEQLFPTDNFWGTPGLYSRPNGIADFDADGIADLYSIVGSQILIRKTRPAARTFEPQYIAQSTGIGWAIPGDFNADGRSDLLFLSASNVKVWYSGIGTDVLQEYPINGVTGISSEETARISLPMDVNGDGITDIVSNVGGSARVHLARFASDGTPSFLSTPSPWASRLEGGVAGDFNNDGLVDLISLGGVESPAPGVDPRLAYMNLSNARDLVPQDWDVPNVFLPAANGGRLLARVADLNGDHLSDIVAVRPDSPIAQVLLSTGRAFRRFEVVLPAPWPGGELVIGDFNGDGLADLSSKDGNLVIALTTVFPDLIVKTTTGLGANSEFSYKPLTDPTVYSKQTGATYPEVDIQNALYVVATMSQDDGKGGRYFIDHTYTGARVHLHGRGFLGFRSIQSRDRQTGRASRTTFRRDFPYEGLTESSEETVGEKLVARTTNTYGKHEYGSTPNTRYFVSLQRSIQEGFEINDPVPQPVVVRTQTDNVWDITYGDLSQTTTEVRGQNASDRHFKITNNTYATTDSGGRPWVDANRWLPGRLSRASVTHKSTGRPDVVRTSSFTYNSTSGLLSSETIEPDQPAFLVNSSYVRNAFGGITSTTVTGGSVTTAFASRTSSITYDAKGRFPISSRNALNHQSSATFDPRFGTALTETDINGNVVRRRLDPFGRQIRVDLPDGTYNTRAFDFVADVTRPYLSYQMRTEASGMPPVVVRMDLIGREVETETIGFDGRALITRNEFNGRGQLVRQSKPFYAGDPILWGTTEYDPIDRTIRQVAPDASVVRMVYSGLTTTAFDPYNRPTVSVRDAMNRTIAVTDALNQTVTYVHDATDNLIEVRDHDGNLTTSAFDIRGRRTQTADPNMGTWFYQYNALGELLSQTDARGVSISMSYDVLGRMVSRLEAEGTTTWTYDTATKGLGMVASVEQNHTGAPLYRETMTYDQFSRPETTTRLINGQSYTYRTFYDAAGRVDRLQYPTSPSGPFTVQNVYNTFNHLASIRGLEDGTAYWTAGTINAVGQVTEESLGNGLTVRRSYDSETDRLLAIQSGTSADPDSVQDLEYGWDRIGNLTSRRDRRPTGNHEIFQYDLLYRLASSRTGLIPALYQTKSFSYSGNGNIASKSDVGNYTYSGDGPHQVTTINGGIAGPLSFDYDEVGNATQWAGRLVTWNSWNMAARITRGAASAEFLYGPDRMRYQMSTDGVAGKATTTYIGGLLEKFVKGDEVTDRYFVFAGDSRVATVEYKTVTTKEAAAAATVPAGATGFMLTGEVDPAVLPALTGKLTTITRSVRYLLKDHLGSTDVVTDESGADVERLSFDPWGQRRLADASALWDDAPSPIIPATTNRGFTDHEHLDELGLINMNGRVYDPQIGRFLSADPNIQAPYNLQNLNRYSYVLNNPLSLTDPSGFFFKKIFRAIKNVVKAVVNFVKENWRQIAAIVVAVYLPGMLGINNAIMKGIVGGFASGLISTGTIKGALHGAITGAAFGFLGGRFGEGGLWESWSNVSKSLAHGVVGGASSVLSGGKFMHGFVAAFAGKYASPHINGIGGRDLAGVLARTTAAAVVGGTASAAVGGNFKNGAITAAYGRLFNAESEVLVDIFGRMIPTTISDARQNPNYIVSEPSSSSLKGALLRVFHPGAIAEARTRDGIQLTFNDSGALIMNGPGAGTLDRIAPLGLATGIGHFVVDVVPWLAIDFFASSELATANLYQSMYPVPFGAQGSFTPQSLVPRSLPKIPSYESGYHQTMD